MDSIIAPKVFISYSWKPILNKVKVEKLAERLAADGVFVNIDIWDLKEGHDKYSFMEQMVTKDDLSRVLLICNKDYAEKANSRTGGVGTESLIISKEIYSKANQDKFIPIIFEYDESGREYVPTFVNSRIYIDLSNEAVFEEGYEQLLRNIFDKPMSKRPPLGTMPAFLQTDEPVFLPTAYKITSLKNALLQEKQNAVIFLQDYLDTFVTSLENFEIKELNLTTENLDENVLKSIDALKALRDDFINFLDVYITKSLDFDQERIHQFFENILSNYNKLPGCSENNTLESLRLDNYRFFHYELFLTFSAIMIDKQKFNELAFILQTPFVIEQEDSRSLIEMTFIDFFSYNITLNKLHNQKLKLNRVSVVADLIKKRAVEKCNFDLLRRTDVLLYYISLFFPNKQKFYRQNWFPELSCYNWRKLDILPRIISLRYFDKVKVLFGVVNKDEMIKTVNTIIEERHETPFDHYYTVPQIKHGLMIDRIATIA